MNRSNSSPFAAARGQRGFSAIEVTAVAAVIFIMALILIPIVNKRVEESKFKAAMEDMLAIEKAEQMAFGYTGHYFRLCDLDRPEPSGPADPLAGVKVPPAYWNKPIMNQTETSYLVTNWKGPFLPPLQLERSLTLDDLSRLRPELCNGSNLPNAATVQGGPIFLFSLDDFDHLHAPNASPPGGAFIVRRYPIDPWGNPYLFFGPGYYGADSGQLALDKPQFSFDSPVIYCLGPDGAVSDAATRQAATISPTAPQYFFREYPYLGTGDDLKREF